MNPTFHFDGWTLDSGRRTLKNPAGDVVAMRPREMALLRIFLDHPQQDLSRAFLVREVWGTHPPAEGSQALTVYISRLRDRLNDRASETPLIDMVSGGYWFCVLPEVLNAET